MFEEAALLVPRNIVPEVAGGTDVEIHKMES
jgi:hypothetical protein